MLEIFKKLFKRSENYRFPDGFHGVIGEKAKDTDFEILGGEEENIPMAKNTFAKLGIIYNQKEVSDMSCTLHGTLGAFSDLTGRVFTVEERRKMWDECKTLGASDEMGWYITDAFNYVYGKVNKMGIGDFKYTRTIFGSDQFFTLLEKGYSIVCGYRGNEEYNKDILSDSKLDLDRLTTPTTYGHCVRITKIAPDKYIVDNYKGVKTWIEKYVVKADIIQLYKNSVFYPSSFAFFYKSDLKYAKVDEKLTARFENRLIINVETSEIALIKNGQKQPIKELKDLFKYKWASGNDSYMCGMTKENFAICGKDINN